MESSLVQKVSSPPCSGMWLLQILKQTCRRLQRVGACASNDLSLHSRAFTYEKPRLWAPSQQRPPFSKPFPFRVPRAAPLVECLGWNVSPKAGTKSQEGSAVEPARENAVGPFVQVAVAKAHGPRSWWPPLPRLFS